MPREYMNFAYPFILCSTVWLILENRALWVDEIAEIFYLLGNLLGQKGKTSEWTLINSCLPEVLLPSVGEEPSKGAYKFYRALEHVVTEAEFISWFTHVTKISISLLRFTPWFLAHNHHLN